MSINRVIHGAFRRDLERFTSALSTLDGGDARRVGQVTTAWANFHQMLTIHHSSVTVVVAPIE